MKMQGNPSGARGKSWWPKGTKQLLLVIVLLVLIVLAFSLVRFEQSKQVKPLTPSDLPKLTPAQQAEVNRKIAASMREAQQKYGGGQTSFPQRLPLQGVPVPGQTGR